MQYTPKPLNCTIYMDKLEHIELYFNKAALKNSSLLVF